MPKKWKKMKVTNIGWGQKKPGQGKMWGQKDQGKGKGQGQRARARAKPQTDIFPESPEFLQMIPMVTFLENLSGSFFVVSNCPLAAASPGPSSMQQRMVPSARRTKSPCKHCIYPKLLLAGCLSPIFSCSRTVCRCPSGWPTMVLRYLLILKEKGFHGKILLKWTWKTNFSKEFHIWYKFSYRCYLAISIVLFSHSVLYCWRWWWSWVNDTSGHMVATAQRHGSF